jgi:hypothetical protein
MNKNIQELQVALSLLLERRQEYVDVINKTNGSPLEQMFLISNEKLLGNIEQLIDIITNSIWHETSTTFHRNRVASWEQSLKNLNTIKNSLFIQNGVSVNFYSSKN